MAYILPEKTNSALTAIKNAAAAHHIRAFLFGDTIKFEQTGLSQFLSKNTIDVVLSGKVDVHDFYMTLSNEVTINQEVENSDYRYSVLSDNFILTFELQENFDPKDLASVRDVARFNIDAIFRDLETDEVIDPGNGLSSLRSEKPTIKSIIPSEAWTATDILGFALSRGSFEDAIVDESDLISLGKITLGGLREPIDISYKDLVLDILLTLVPGKALSFIGTTFPDGKEWVFGQLLDLMVSFNVPLSSDVTPSSILDDKKLELVNVYNQFFLHGREEYEIPADRKNRIITTLRLLYDSPSLDIRIPYIDRVSVLSSSLFEESTAGGPGSQAISLFGDDDPCEYGQCPPCDPEDCSPQCCCCHHIDILLEAQLRCHEQIVLSCNEDGSGPAPGETFPPACGVCLDACAAVLGLIGGIGQGETVNCSTLSDEPWWVLPYDVCECSCKQSSGGGACELSCVTCAGFFCKSEATVTSSECAYNINLTPGPGCCGTPVLFDTSFVIDVSGSMGQEIVSVAAGLQRFVVLGTERGVLSNLSLTTFRDDVIFYGWKADGTFSSKQPGSSPGPFDFTIDIPSFQQQLDGLTASGGGDEPEAQFEALSAAMLLDNLSPATSKILFVVTDASSHTPPTLAQIINQAIALNFSIVYIGPFNGNQDMGTATGGLAFELPPTGGSLEFFEDVFAEVANIVGILPSSCDCLDFTPIPIRRNDPACLCCKDGIQNPCIDDPFDTECINNLPEWCFEIPIRQCKPGDNCTDPDFCKQALQFNVCGNVVIIQPEQANLICCSDIPGGGCDCPDDPSTGECCGVVCWPDFCTVFAGMAPRAIVDAVWCDCWSKRAFIEPGFEACADHCCCPEVDSSPGDPNYPCDGDLWDPTNPEHRELLEAGHCCACPSIAKDECCNCCLKVEGNETTYCRDQIEAEVLAKLEECEGIIDPPPTWDPPNLECDRKDRCIVGEPDTSKLLDDQCHQAGIGCASIRHPSVVVLNNGIGLVAFEDMDQNTIIKVQQFRTSLGNKLLPNREFGFGRLQHNSKWTTTAKIYIYEDPPKHLLSSDTNLDPLDPTTWKDAIAFKDGPLEKQFFPLALPTCGEDEIGQFIRFFAPAGTVLSNAFPSSDDVYNVRFFIFDFEDTGVIGDSTEDEDTTIGNEFVIEDRTFVDEKLQLPEHIYNGEAVPVAYPSLATAYNYSDPNENAHFVYLVYQAFEDKKWNVYLRQMRLSEYEREEQISGAISGNRLITIASLGTTDVVYRTVCVGDSCSSIGDDKFLLKRTMAMEVLLEDGREVLNPGLTGNWPSLCPAHSSGEFPKQKVFVQAIHSAVADRCPDQFEFDEIFFKWEPGNEFIAPASNISPSGLLPLLGLPGDTSVGEGSFEPPLDISGIKISSASFGATWFEDIVATDWSVISGSDFDILSKFKGLDIGEPIPITTTERGHCTRPVVKVNYNNDVYIAFECSETGIQQIRITGTATPSSSLPIGVFNPKNPDTLGFFLNPLDFTYQSDITIENEGTNQLVDMFIDFNDVVHMSWQSNRNRRWEIYYANSETNFLAKRITDHPGKSLRPTIDGDNFGRMFIAWHDDRFGDYEVMMAYLPGSRVLPLAQQDPYLASVRNEGYSHSLNEIPLLLKNTTNRTICLTDLIVDFFFDRNLENLAFSIDQRIWPFVFSIPEALNDTTSEVFTDFTEYTGWTETTDDTDPYIPARILESAEYDSEIAGSIIFELITKFLKPTGAKVFVAFRGSDIQNDPLAAGQWTNFKQIFKNGTMPYRNLQLPDVPGLYKQVRVKLTGISEYATMISLTVVSMALHRICLPPGGKSTAFLDLTPELRVDKFGDELAEFPIPIAFIRNNTYFIKVRAIDDDGTIVTMPPQLRSVSCESCSPQASTWNLESCSLHITLENNNNNDRAYNLRVTFYYDREKTRKIVDFDAFPGSPDLRCFTVAEKQPAEAEWGTKGLLILEGKRADIALWPSLLPTSGLLCGIKYYVDIKFCTADARGDQICSREQLKDLSSTIWVCNCQSLRWDPRFEDSPVNFREMVRWHSSGDGGADTRLTESIGVNNLNPVIQMRSNLNGVILYESNRAISSTEDQDTDIYRIYASVFSVIPASNMYASGAQSIISPFEQIIHRSDIPICEDEGCFDENNQRIVANEILQGRSPAMDLDQYDSIFLAIERPVDQTTCQEFKRDRQQYVVVHNCGADALDLFREVRGQEESLAICDAQEIVGKSFQADIDPLLATIIRKIRVRNEFVLYHITRNEKPSPVVDKCSIGFIVIGTPETTAVRLRNGSSEWSRWFPMDSEIGENTINIDWDLTPESGTKSVQFQAATYAGLSITESVTIIADYTKIVFDVNLYKPFKDSPVPPDPVDLSDANIWLDSNRLKDLDDIPVAAMRRPKVETIEEEKVLILSETDYIFVEIVPSIEYMRQFESIPDEEKASGLSEIEPTFDFVQQGSDDKFNVGTIWARNAAGKEVFRGVFEISKDNKGSSKDGLAFVVPHFKNDCSDASSVVSGSSDYIKDSFNVVVPGIPAGRRATEDVWAKDRDKIGRIEHKIVIRPNEDPYFIFGDPNYRLKRQDE